MTKIRLIFEGGPEVVVQVRPDPTPTVARLLESLPFWSDVHRWGDEIYFDAPFHSELEEDARAEMSVGDLAYWPDGDAIALFFGPTPASEGASPRAYSPCNILGSVECDPDALRSVRAGAGAEMRPG